MKKHGIYTGDKFSRQKGFSILEVLIGIFIFVVGLLALSALQGALTRSMADAKVRTTATNIADRVLESQRGFSSIQSDTATPKTFLAYNDIVSAVTTETVDGVTYTIDMDVSDFYYQLGSDAFSTTAPTGAVASTYKQVEVTVSWDAAQNFRANEGADVTAADLGSGNIVLTATIPALVTSASALVADESGDSNVAAPPVTYTPGLNPDIVSLSLGDSKFKESLLPEPDVIRSDELVETRFDVITYSQTNSGAQFLRREEFASVSCECTLKAPDATVTSHRPVIWAGDEYVRGQHAVGKPYGVSANNSQSPLCDACCRDHHDGGTASDPADHADTAVNTFVPFKPSAERITTGTFSGDHKHYSRPRTGLPIEVTTADSVYVEACRLVRVDGFFRVAQDFRREDLNIFPNDFLDSTNEIDMYSGYVTNAALEFANATFPDYETNPPCIGPSGCAVSSAPKQGAYPDPIATDSGNPTEMPSWTTLPLFTAATQQLRSRGLYIDYLSSDLRRVLDRCDPASETADDADCMFGDVVLNRTGSVNTLELIPFFDVQMTKLNRWNETPVNIPVNATNEPLADLNTHSRGVISKSSDGESTVFAAGHRGNLGFTDTLPIDPAYSSQLTSANLFVHAGSASTPPVGITVSGALTETVPGNPNIVVIGLGGVQCGQTSASYSCFIPQGTVNPRLELSGYGKSNTIRWACSTGVSLAADAINTVTNGANAKATFSLSLAPAGTNYNFAIEQSDTNPCI